MALWGNTDTANSKPLLPVEREVREVTILTTNTAIASGNTLTFTTTVPSSIAVGQYVYSLDANNAVSKFFDGSVVDQNDVSFLKANNTVKSIDAANSTVVLNNALLANLATGSKVYFANVITYKTGTQATTYYADTILVTPTRAANNTTGTGAVANVGNFTAGWVHVQKKTNADGAVRYLRETLVALANPVASNTASGNTSFGSVFTGV
jgi:hypothetical protein